jgi:hypothetical protein
MNGNRRLQEGFAMPPRTGTAMPRKRKTPDPAAPPTRRQFNISFPPEMAARIEATAKALGLDGTGLLRMIVHEHLAEYESRAAAAKRGAASE